MKIAVIVATHNRYKLLTTRALPSIALQTRRPDFLIVCDDSTSAEHQQSNEKAVNELDLNICQVIYTKNQRSPGASGCWNTAIDTLLNQSQYPEDTLVAFLDDDDSWQPTYLESAESQLVKQNLDMVAAGIRRIECLDEQAINLVPPTELNESELLTTNPGIQGSNLFLKLTTLLRAGAFDENLSSSTDRDLCIRLADMGDVAYQQLNEVMVDHYADTNRTRLSTKGSANKLNGLSRFWQKYSGRMNETQRILFEKRASELFDWKLCEPNKPQSKETKDYTPQSSESSFEIQPAPKHSPFALVIGVITSEPNVLLPLLISLTRLTIHKSISSLSILVLDNHSQTSALKQTLSQARESGLTINLISPEQYQQDTKSGLFGSEISLQQTNQQMSIATARTLIQRYLGISLVNTPGAIGWLLDDDMRIDKRADEYLPWLPEFRLNKVDVLLGAYEGSSPNPPLNGLRVQLLDLLHNLKWLENLSDTAALPDRSNENKTIREQYPDYYYDLSRKHYSHLETPLWIEPSYPLETVAEAKSRLVAGALGILNGDPLTRGIVATSPKNPLFTAQDSVNRGGCTFILNYKSLEQTPNSIPKVQGREARRSDMIWSITNKHYRGMCIKAVSFPILHVGRIHDIPTIKTEKVQGEIAGSALYAGLTEFLKSNPEHQLNFTNYEAQKITQSAMEHMDIRLRALKHSFYRIAGLCESLNKLNSAPELDQLIQHLNNNFNFDAYQRIQSGVKELNYDDVISFLTSLRGSADKYTNGLTNKKLASTN